MTACTMCRTRLSYDDRHSRSPALPGRRTAYRRGDDPTRPSAVCSVPPHSPRRPVHESAEP